MYVCIYVCMYVFMHVSWKKYDNFAKLPRTWRKTEHDGSAMKCRATSARPSHAAGEETCLRGLPVQVPWLFHGETWNLENASSDNWSWNGAEMDLKWWKAIKRVVMSAECPNHVGNWKLFESPRSSMSSCHGHFSTSLPPSPWNSCLAGHQGISRIFWHFPKANPRHPTAPPKALGTCC
jgi:hypothetical protein